MNMKEVKESLKNKEYDFLRTDAPLAGCVGMLCMGGSIAYGTNLPDKGDVDIRGFAFEPISQIIGTEPNFSTYVERETDTVIYSFRKLIELLISNNPNTIEQLGCKPEHYLYKSEIADELLKNADMFISKNCIRSFAGYANQQLNRLENAIARDRLTQERKEEHMRLSMLNAMAAFSDRYTQFENGSIVLYTDVSQKEGLDKEIFLDINLKHYPVRDFNSILNEFTNITRVYGKLNHRNKKKDEEHLDKHAMHLLRLYYMVFDLLENKKVVTYREKERDFLLQVRQGLFRKEDGSYNQDFFDLREELDKRFKYDMEHSELPEGPDMKRINEFVMWANSKILRGDFVGFR